MLNGALNLSVLDGWWAEAYDGANGFAIGKGSSHVNPEITDARDAEALYRTLEDLVAVGPLAEELEWEVKAQVAKVRATGVRLSYVDYHMATQAVPGATEMMNQVCREERLIYDQVGLCEHAHLSPESWTCVRHDDGQVVWVCGPAFTPEQRQGFWDGLRALGPGRWWTPVHPGSREPQSVSIVELLLDSETRRIIDERGIRLISHHDLWAEVYG